MMLLESLNTFLIQGLNNIYESGLTFEFWVLNPKRGKLIKNSSNIDLPEWIWYSEFDTNGDEM